MGNSRHALKKPAAVPLMTVLAYRRLAFCLETPLGEYLPRQHEVLGSSDTMGSFAAASRT